MTIAIHQVDNALKAYRKQNKPINLTSRQPETATTPTETTPTDTVTLSSETDRMGTTDKVSYSLLDVLLKNRQSER